jgi:hypothetical protein
VVATALVVVVAAVAVARAASDSTTGRSTSKFRSQRLTTDRASALLSALGLSPGALQYGDERARRDVQPRSSYDRVIAQACSFVVSEERLRGVAPRGKQIVAGGRAFSVVGFVALLAVSCGLEVVGTASDAHLPHDDASTETDASTTIDAPTETDGTTGPVACTSALPPGWSPVAWAAARSTPCPADYEAADWVLPPTSTTGACTCACTIAPTDPPSCAKGTLQGASGPSTCDTGTAPRQVSGTGCTSLGGPNPLASFAQYAVLPLYGGTCVSSVMRNAGAIAPAPARACRPTRDAATALCAGTAPEGFSACIVHDDDVACPTGPYAAKTVAGSEVSLSCGGCATCQNKLTCPPSTALRYYDTADCSSELGSRIVDGSCQGLASGVAGSTVTHYRYDVIAAAPTCASTSSPTTQVALETQRTICCR